MGSLDFCPHPELSALTALYEATNGDRWYGRHGWLSDVPLNRWAGITLNENLMVSELKLNRNGLDGEIPPELAQLTELKVLDLGNSGLYDPQRAKDICEARLSGVNLEESGERTVNCILLFTGLN